LASEAELGPWGQRAAHTDDLAPNAVDLSLEVLTEVCAPDDDPEAIYQPVE
jgi:hypothetical protein